MAFTNSPLVSYTRLSPNHSGQRTHAIDRITPHCVVGQASVEGLGNTFAPVSRKASCQYGIGADGRIGMYCEEKNKSWCSSSNENDQRAVTIECASDATAPYAFRPVVYNKLIELCVDVCKRNNKNILIWFGDKNTTLNYQPKPNEMILTVHRWFAKKSCPGDWMYARMSDLANQVTARLKNPSNSEQPTQSTQHTQPVDSNTFKPYKVKVEINNLNIRSGPGTNYYVVKICPPNIYTIVAESKGKGATMWGRLKSGIGWISLDHVKKEGNA